MRSVYPWPIFPSGSRSLSLQLALQEWLASFAILERIEQPSDLEKLFLFSIDNPLDQKVGTLDKLSFLTKRIRSPLLEELLDRMREEVFSLRKKLTEVKHALNHRLLEFFDAIFPLIEESKSDENLLFFLIENKDRFNAILAPKKVEHLLSKLYPSGPTHLRAILCEGYTRRGFSDFYQKHEALIDSIEWI